MTIEDYPTFEIELVILLLSQNGNRTCVTPVDGEPMRVTQVEITDLPSAIEWDHFAEIGGIGLSADNIRYCFYLTEIGSISDMATGLMLFARESTSSGGCLL